MAKRMSNLAMILQFYYIKNICFLVKNKQKVTQKHNLLVSKKVQLSLFSVTPWHQMHKKFKQQRLEDRLVLWVMMQCCEAKNCMELLEQPHRDTHTQTNTAHEVYCMGSSSWRAWFLFLSLNPVCNGRWSRRTDVSLYQQQEDLPAFVFKFIKFQNILCIDRILCLL